MKNIWIIALISIVLGVGSCSKEKKRDIMYTVTFNSDGGSPTPDVQTIKAGDQAAAPATNPAKTGYLFLFWYIEGATTAYNFQTPINRNITLYTKWQQEVVPEYWQVTWELNGGAWPASDNHATQALKGGTLSEPAAPTKSDYTFDGWYKEAALTNKVDFPYDVGNITGNITLYAKWLQEAVAEHWQVTWVLSEGAWPTGDNHATQVLKGGTLPEPAAPTKSSHTFEGWYKEVALTNKIDFPYDVSSVTGNITLYAKWKQVVVPEYWQVAWELNGGVWPTGDNHATQVLKGGTLAEPAAPAKADHTFEGWYNEVALTNKVNFPYNVNSITANITLYAKWKSNVVTPPSNNHTISSATEWNTAIAAVNAAGAGKTHTFTITKSFSLPSSSVNIFDRDMSNVTVTIKGQGIPAPEISLASGSTGHLLYFYPRETQKLILENITLKGHAANTTPAIIVDLKGELTLGNGALITGNTNTEGYGGGVRVGSTLILKGGNISGNTAGTAQKANGKGGGVYMADFAKLIIESGSVSRNIVHGQGGGVFVGFSATLSMKGGIISGNTARALSAGARGGGVYNSYGNIHMSGGKITGYDWIHGNDNIEGHNPAGALRDDCNIVIITASLMGIYGAALYDSGSGKNLYGTFNGETFNQTGGFGSNIHIERDIEVADGVRLNRFVVNSSIIFDPYRGQVDYCGHFFNTSTENVWLELFTISDERIAIDMLVPNGNNRLVAGTYTFNSSGATAPAFTFVNNDYTSYVQDASGIRARMTAGTVKVSITGTGDNAVYTIAIDCTLENGGKVSGTYRGKLTWRDAT